jgi:hypothetical protein
MRHAKLPNFSTRVLIGNFAKRQCRIVSQCRAQKVKLRVFNGSKKEQLWRNGKVN